MSKIKFTQIAVSVTSNPSDSGPLYKKMLYGLSFSGDVYQYDFQEEGWEKIPSFDITPD